MYFKRLLNLTLINYKKPNLKRLSYNFCNKRMCHILSSDSHEGLIVNNTMISRDHLTPEIKLRLITPECSLYHCKATESKFSDDPFWGIYWPGGQALARYILDNPEVFYDKNILDIGSGSGACALAAAKCGANVVLANDIDPVSIIAITLNAKLNKLTINTYSQNLIGEDVDSLTLLDDDIKSQPKWDVILIGDMFYDPEFSSKLFIWLCDCVKKGKKVFIGDPGRYALKNLNQMSEHGLIVRIAEYGLKNKEHNGFTNSAVYTIECLKVSN